MNPRSSTQRSPVAARGLALAALLALGCATPPAIAAQRYAGACDASAAAALDDRHFVVANDENNTLAVHRIGEPVAVGSIALDRFLGVGHDAEADIEGAAAIGTRIYWITSHARDSKGRAQPDRRRLFATDILAGAPPGLAPVGRPYTHLVEDLLAAPGLASYGLAAATGRAAEAERGFNIEGLAATPDGRLLIGLRNPLIGGRALLIPLDNPEDVVLQGKPARLGVPMELDLGGRGIRSIERVGADYLIAAGPPADAGSFAIYRWSGGAQDAPEALAFVALDDLRPEALFALPGSAQAVLLSDDGGVRAGKGRACKDLPAARQSFRALGFRP